MSRATFDFEIVNYIIYYRRGSEKTRSDTVVYKLLDYFRWVELRMAQIACDFVRLIGLRLLSSSFGLGGHFRKNQYWFSAVSLIFTTPGTSRRVDFSPPRSDISRYAPVFFPLSIDDFNCFLLRNPMNFNCFFRHFNCVNTQIRSLIRVLFITVFSNIFKNINERGKICKSVLWRRWVATTEHFRFLHFFSTVILVLFVCIFVKS